MSVRPAYFRIEAPSSIEAMEVCIGFAWGGDATQEVSRADRHAFKEVVLERFRASLEEEPELLDAMMAESHPHDGQRRYRGGVKDEHVQAKLDEAVSAAMQQVCPGRPCSAVLVVR